MCRLAVMVLSFGLAVHPAVTSAEPPATLAGTKPLAGPAARLVLAQRTYQAAIRDGDAILMLAAIRLARGVALRPPTSWTRTTLGDAPTDQPTGRAAAPDAAAPEVLAVLKALAEEDPALQDLVYDLDAQRPQGRVATATRAFADLGGGQTDEWRMALSGDVPAEIALIGDGDTALELTILADDGSKVCTFPPGSDPTLCRFVPSRNGFFTVTVRNTGLVWNRYQLLGSWSP